MNFNISGWSIRKPVPSIVLFAVLMFLGVMSFLNLPVTRFPNIDIPVLTVTITQSGAGEYTYQWDQHTEVRVAKTYADALAGYQMRFGELTAKAFAGWAFLDDIDVPAAGVQLQRIHHGFKGALELWLNLGADAWTSLDLSYADTRDMTSVRSRTGYRVLPTVSVGFEGGFNHASLAGQVQIEPGRDRVEGTLRAGAFVRYEWFGGEVSASGGITGDTLGSIDADTLLRRPAAYGTVNWIAQF